MATVGDRSYSKSNLIRGKFADHPPMSVSFILPSPIMLIKLNIYPAVE